MVPQRPNTAGRLKKSAPFSLVLTVDERQRALEDLYRHRYISFRNGIAPIAGSYESARDFVQEAFARALRERRRYRGEGTLEAWVWKIALRAALEARRNGRDLPLDEALSVATLPEPERDPELAEALKSLSPRRRLIVFLRYFADLPYAEIAVVCGISEGTVAASLAQARASLSAMLDKQGVER